MNKNLKFDFAGKTAVVIGGAGSIGREISKAFLESGADVAVCDLPPPKKDISYGTFFAVDVTDEKSVEKLAREVAEHFHKIDILVLSQGVQHRQPFADFTLEEWNKVLRVNLTGAFLACKHFSKPMMEAKHGKIVAITSLTSEFGIKNISAYAASKGGLAQFLKTAAVELADYNINVNMVAPGRIKTDMTADLLKDPKMAESNLRCIPLKRFGEPSDVAGVVLFLASDSASYITGQTIFVDGGWLASGGNPGD